jgi:hypothetical protein
MPVEDFSQAYWVQTDPNNHIAIVGTNHVDFQDYRNEDAYFRRDMGAGHFTNFTHLIDVKCVSGNLNHLAYPWFLSNEIDDGKGLYDAGKTFIGMRLYSPSTNVHKLYLEECTAGADYVSSDPYTITAGTTYYLKFEKSGTALTLKIYSDSARTNLLATLSLTLHGSWNFRYIFVCNTWNSGATYNGDEDLENLDLQEVTLKQVSDSLSLADSLLRHKTLPITDSVGLSDAVLRHKPLLQVLDSIGVSDQTLANKILVMLDSVLLADSVLRHKPQLEITDSIALTEAIEITIAGIMKCVTDAISLSDSALTHKTLIIADSVALTEEVIRDKILAILDAIGLTEQTLIGKHVQILDQTNLLDVTRVQKNLVVTDQIQLTDNLYINKILILSDQIALVELVQKTATSLGKIFLVLNLQHSGLDLSISHQTINLNVENPVEIELEVD